MKNLQIFIFLIFLLFKNCTPGDLAAPDLVDASIGTDDITITLANNNIVADNKATTDVVVKVGSNIVKKSNISQVTFSISPIGKFSDGTTSLTKLVDTDGKTFTSVKSDTEGEATITVSIGSYSKQATIKFYKVQSTFITELVANNVEADNYHYSILKFTTNIPDVSKQITFTTDRGNFSNNSNTYTTQITSDGITNAYLKYNKAEIAKVTVTISTIYSQELNVQFIAALPEQIFIEAAPTNLPPILNSKAKITAKLVRSLGSVSEGQIVLFSASTPTGDTPGVFYNTSKSNSTGEATTDFLILNPNYTGFVDILGYIENNGVKKPVGTNRLLIK